MNRPGQDVPLVSAVLVNYRGAADTVQALDALQQVSWPVQALELVVVDNASGDGSVAAIRSACPRAQVVESPANTGFAGGCNLGARHAGGRYLAFVNNDARPDPEFLRAAVPVLEADLTIGAIACRVLDWTGTAVDFVGGSLSWYGFGFKDGVGAPAAGRGEVARDVLFGTGSGMVVRAEAFAAAGGFDERYFMFFEDVDLGWRLWLLGHRVRYLPASVVYHRHHGTMQRYGAFTEQYLLERNALFTIYKNYDEERLAALLPAALALAVRRGLALGAADPHALDLARGSAEADRPEGQPGADDDVTLPKSALTGAYAVAAFAEALPGLARSRRELQAARVRSDAELLPLFGHPLRPNVEHPAFLPAYEGVMEAMAVADRFAPRRRVLVATADALGPAMAGPAIRAWHIAAALAAEHEVQLVTTSPRCELVDDRFRIRSVDASRLVGLGRWADVLVVQGDLLTKHPRLQHPSTTIVVDVYDPFHLELLEQARDAGEDRRAAMVRAATAALNDQLLRGDFFLCASAKQRDFWLGQLSALGRVNPLSYDEDPTLGSLIAVVPFGVEETPPVHLKAAVRGVIPGIGADDELLLWGGGVYNWLDPVTLVEAVGKLSTRRPRLRLLFLGMRHPNPEVPEMAMARAVRDRAEELGLTGRVVYFHEEWVPYGDRGSYLLEADIGVSTHLDHVETQFSFRTRVLDYVWAGLPVVTTRGDALADLVEAEGLGLTVPPGDVDALVVALDRLLADDSLAAGCRAAAAEAVPGLRWSVALGPLVAFVREARRAPDLLDRGTLSALRQPIRTRPAPVARLRASARRARDVRRSEGVGPLLLRLCARALRVAARR